MNCRKVNNLLSAYMDGELAGVEHLQVQHHLRDCCACYEEYQSLLVTKRLLAGLSMRQPDVDLEARILQHLGSQRAAPPRRSDLGTWWSVLTERERQRLRLGMLCGTMCALALVLASTRINRALQSGADIDGRGAPAIALSRGAAPLAYGPPPVPPADFIQAHSSWANAQPFGPGVSVQAVSSTGLADGYLVPASQAPKR